MKRLFKLMLVSVLLFLTVMIGIILYNKDNQGFIVLFNKIALYQRIGEDIMWLNGIYVLLAIISGCTLLAAMIYDLLFEKKLNFDFSGEDSSILMIVTIYFWTTNLLLLGEIALHGEENFTSSMGFDFNYFNPNGFVSYPLEYQWYGFSYFILITLLVLAYKIIRRIVKKKYV